MVVSVNISNRKRIITAVLVLTGVLVIALYLELLGWRIIYAGTTFGEVFGLSFLAGALRNTAGAALLGFLFLGLAFIPHKMRKTAKKYSILIWCIGAALFLLVLLLLIYWAPT